MRYLITGGAGFLGAALVRRLLCDGHDIRVLDDYSRGSMRRLEDLSATIDCVTGDVRDADVVRRAVRGVDRVVHLAAVNGTEHFYRRPELVLDVGVRGTLNVLDACRAAGVSDLTFLSSSEVYQLPPVIPTDESAPCTIPDVLNQRYSYAGSKLIGELLVLNWGRRDFQRVVVVRPHNVYGPNMGLEHVIPQLIIRAVDGIARTPSGPIPFPIQGDGSQTRAFVHIDDFTEGLRCVLDRGAHQNVYHIGNPEEITVREVAEQVVGCFGRTCRIISGSLPAGSTPRRCPDIAKVRSIGFAPLIPFAEGLRGTVTWYREHLPQSVAA